MASPAWRGLWRALARCGHPRYTTQPPPRLTPWKTAGVADGPGGHLAVQRHAISRTFDLIRATHTEESTTRLPTDSRYTHHRPSWVHPHPRSRSFSATSNSLLQHVKADANSDLTVASPGDGGDGPGDMAMFNRFASAQPLALVAQGIANVSGDSPLDYPLVKAEDNGFTEGIMCYLLKAGADQIVPHTVIFWLLHLRVQSLKVIGDFHMLNTSNCQEWVQEHVGATFEQKLVDPAIEATKFYTENRMIRLIPQIIKIGFAAIHLMYSADPEEVNCWQIRYLTKAPQAAGVIHFDFERCFICVELPPDLGLLLDAFTRTNEPDSIYGIMMIKVVYAYLDLTQTCGRKMLPKMWSSCYILPQLQIGRFFSRRKIKCVDEFSLKAKNSSILCLDGSFPEVRSSLRKVIAQLRQFCYDHGQRIDVSSIYGPGKVVYTPPGIGTFDLKVLHCKKWISFPILASDLYFPGFRSENGLFVLRQLSNFTCDEGYYMLGFTGSYTVADFGGQEVGDTWVGVEALRHAFHVISKSTGTTYSLKQALKIFVIHIAEAARIQSVLKAICHSMTDGGRTYLDETETGASPAPPTFAPSPKTEASPGTSPPSSETETEADPSVFPATSPPSSATEAAPVASPPTPPPSYWIGAYAHYSLQLKKAIDAQLTSNEKYIIVSKGAYQVTSVDDILKQIRILSRVHLDSVFAQEAADSVLTLPKECAMGKEVEHPYVLLEEWDTGKCL